MILEKYDFVQQQPQHLQERLDHVLETWQPITPADVQAEMAEVTVIEPTDETSRAYVLDPVSGDVDETQSIVLAAPHRNGWTPHHYIRARFMQEVLLPQSRVVFLPNNAAGQTNYDLSYMSDAKQDELADGNILPFGEHQMRTVEHVATKLALGRIGATGYSLGGRTVAGMVASGSDKLEFVSLNIDEAPHKYGRTAFGLQKDFPKSGSMGDLMQSIDDSHIPALSEFMSKRRANIDVAKFVATSLGSDARKMTGAMTGSMEDVLDLALAQGIPTKLGRVAGSLMVDNSWENTDKPDNLRLFAYEGDGFNGHATGDNVPIHAVMAYQGLMAA